MEGTTLNNLNQKNAARGVSNLSDVSTTAYSTLDPTRQITPTSTITAGGVTLAPNQHYKSYSQSATPSNLPTIMTPAIGAAQGAYEVTPMRHVSYNQSVTTGGYGGGANMLPMGITLNAGYGGPSRATVHGMTFQGPTTMTTNMITGPQRILREEVVEHEVRMPRKRLVEETIEKVVVVPEKITREEVVVESKIVRERIIEIAKPVIQEKIVEVPEYEYVEKIVEYPQIIVQEKIREVPKIVEVENIVYVPKIIHQERIVEVPDIEYRDVIQEKVVEVPEVRTEYKIVEKPVPQYVEVPVPQIQDIEIVEEVERQIPIPVEHIKQVEYRLPGLKSRYEKVPMPVYIPRFVEIAIPSDQMTEDSIIFAEHAVQQVALAAASGAPSLCELELLAERIRKFVPETTDSAETIRRRLARNLPHYESDPYVQGQALPQNAGANVTYWN